jgi:excisionase family DNA binding protein
VTEPADLQALVRELVTAELRQRLGHGGAANENAAEVMTAEQTAAFLGVDRKTVYEHAARGAIPHQRLGKRLLFSRHALVAWLGACKSASTGRGL